MTPLWRSARIAAVVALAMLGTGVASAEQNEDPWAAYLDYAYVYSSAEPGALAARLAGYARQSGVSLDRYLAEAVESPVARRAAPDETRGRRAAIAYLLQYVATGNAEDLEKSVEAVEAMGAQLGRHENRYWHHYILAHQALETRDSEEFVRHVMDLWLEVVAPLETPYETLRTLSLSQSPSAGFAAALPYVYENLSRLILIRSQQKGLDQGLDPLASVVRMLHDGRVGAHTDVIPPGASSRDYLDRIVQRLDGSESDAGSLTFTLSLFEARKVHDRARTLLAEQGLSEATLEAFRATTQAYQAALDRAHTTQGHCAVFTRGLRELGELYAARQRLGVETEIETPFTIGKATNVYATLHHALDGGWEELGYRIGGRDELLDTMRRLWEEIQETSLNAAAYHLSQASEGGYRAGDHLRNAARIGGRYLDFFHRYAKPENREGLPESAYFAAYEAAKGFGDAYLAYPDAKPSATEIELATRRYVTALRFFPFDAHLYGSLRAALERQGRVNDYLGLARKVAETTTKSSMVAAWIARKKAGSERVATMQRALGDDLAILYLGFADGQGLAELEQSLGELRASRSTTAGKLGNLVRQRDALARGEMPEDSPPASPGFGSLDLEDLERRIEEAKVALARIDRQIDARSHALPLYRQALASDDLPQELSARRDHPVHELLRRLFEERDEKRARLGR